MFYEDPSEYIEYFPDFWQDILEIETLDKVIKEQLDKLLQTIKGTVDNKFPATAGEEGIARWEKILGLSNPLNSSLKSRREAVRAKLMAKPPINLRKLQSVIEEYMGVEVTISISNYVVMVGYRGETLVNDLTPLYATIYEMIPANLIVNIIRLYNTHSELAPNTHIDLQKYTHDQLRTSEVFRNVNKYTKLQA